MAAKFDLNDDSIVVIIGSGAGGGTVANELAQRGVKSVILEAGKTLSLEDIENDEWSMFSKISWLDKRQSAGSWHGAVNHPGLPAWIVKGLGGSTVHWAGVSIRYQEHEFKMKTTSGGVAGANLLDWPITLDELKPWYDKAELKMGTTGEVTGMPHLPWSADFKVLAEGARRIGYSKITAGPMSINSEARDGRPACQQIGFCMQGCKIGAKWSTLYTELPRAVDTGNCEIRTNCMVLQVEHDKSGKVTGVVYADQDGKKQRQKARVVCVAGNSIESPRLLLNSESSLFPNGLANSSGQVGRNYMTHMTAGVYGVMPGEVHMNRGTAVAGIVRDEAHYDDTRGFAGGYTLEKLALGLGFLSAFLVPGPTGWGREVSSGLENYKYMSGVWICGEDMPQEQNRIALHATEKDQYGLPIPVVHKTDHPNDTNMRNHAYGQMAKIYHSLGAKKIYNLPAYPASHNMGTNRMSAKPEDGVVNKWGQSHDIKNLFVSDGSQFTTSASPNPTLTIVALAIRQADYLATQLKKGAI
ncbi:MAG: GMC family oxidoreductase [Alphaproteobacteria bacterium]|nr:GMC family oxidoreductase [Alphaproteobacteria bacterium]